MCVTTWVALSGLARCSVVIFGTSIEGWLEQPDVATVCVIARQRSAERFQNPWHGRYSGGMDRTDVLVAVDVPLVGDERRKNWAKIVNNVDPDKSSGWAFEGDFVSVGGVQDLPVGGVLLIYGERGSRTNPMIEAHVYRVNADATLTREDSSKGRAWARTLRDAVVELLEGPEPVIVERDWAPELMLFSESALREELRRRAPG